MSTLTPTAIADFIRDGIVVLRSAVAADALEGMRSAVWNRLERSGHRRDDPTTWSGASGMHFNRIAKHPVFAGLSSERLCGACDDLLGAGRYLRPASWGMFAITAPQPGPPWEPVASGWHADCSPQTGARCALFVLILLADCPPGGGGTLLIAGSARALARDGAALTPCEAARKARVHRQRFAASHPWLAQLHGAVPLPGPRASFFQAPSSPTAPGEYFQVVEVHGHAGDAYLCHPFVYHAASTNRSTQVRMMRIKMLSMAPGSERDDPSSEHPIARSLRPLTPSAESRAFVTTEATAMADGLSS